VHIMTGPIHVCGAEPGDVLQVDILDLWPRKNPKSGKTYGVNAAASWGYQWRQPYKTGVIWRCHRGACDCRLQYAGGLEVLTLHMQSAIAGVRTGSSPVIVLQHVRVSCVCMTCQADHARCLLRSDKPLMTCEV
jgi:hypothetical protein